MEEAKEIKKSSSSSSSSSKNKKCSSFGRRRCQAYYPALLPLPPLLRHLPPPQPLLQLTNTQRAFWKQRPCPSFEAQAAAVLPLPQCMQTNNLCSFFLFFFGLCFWFLCLVRCPFFSKCFSCYIQSLFLVWVAIKKPPFVFLALRLKMHLEIVGMLSYYSEIVSPLLLYE